jgi:hypothetical protein
MDEYTGWLLDVYAHPQDGVVLWFMEGRNGARLRLKQRFPVTFYISGPSERLRAVWRFLICSKTIRSMYWLCR